MADMTLYVVDETKLDNLSAQNDESKTFYSAASALASLGVGFFVNQFFTDHLSDRGWLISWIAGPVLVFLAILCACLGHKFSRRSKTTLGEIKKNKAVTSVGFTLKQE